MSDLAGVLAGVDAAYDAQAALHEAQPLDAGQRGLAAEHAEAVVMEVSRGAVGDRELVVADLLTLSERVFVLCAQVDAMEADRNFWKDRCEPPLFPRNNP